MPLYSYHCPACGDEVDEMRRLAESDAPGPLCCGAPMPKRITAPMVAVKAFENYRCPMSGEVVQSFRRRDYLMKQNNVVDAREFEGHWQRVEAKRKAERAAVAAEYEKLPEAVKKAGKELSAVPDAA